LRTVLSGRSADLVYGFGDGKRLVTSQHKQVLFGWQGLSQLRSLDAHVY
jgi:hypothetical protein